MLCGFCLVTYWYALGLIRRIHFAIDPAYATGRGQKRQVKQFKIGDRIRVVDKAGEDTGTITE